MLQLTTSLTSEVVEPVQKASDRRARIAASSGRCPGCRSPWRRPKDCGSLDPTTCSAVLSELVETGFLSRRTDGSFCRASDLAARPLRMAKATNQGFGDWGFGIEETREA